MNIETSEKKIDLVEKFRNCRKFLDKTIILEQQNV